MARREAEGVVRRIVTSFIQYREGILLLKRSSQVRTYQGHWAGVSGTIEEEEQARQGAEREIGEETGLRVGQHLSFLRSGRPLLVPSLRYSTHFLVHPFLFRLNPEISATDTIKIDWEHTEYKFMPPREMLTLETVPNLLDTYLRVALDDEDFGNFSESRSEAGGVAIAAASLMSALNAIRNDTSHGAAYLTAQALKAFDQAVSAFPPPLYTSARLV